METDDDFQTKRGINVPILLAHIENTAPFLFAQQKPLVPYTQIVLDRRRRPEERLTHLQYFELCLCAHYTTVATFVPTDVDNQIRKSLWDQPLPLSTLEAMAELTLRSLDWDFRPLTARLQRWKDLYISGHQGEWLTVAGGAYCALLGKSPQAEVLSQKIQAELHHEAKIFQELKKMRDGKGLLCASTAIAHNLGDLDRVLDFWNLPADDPLRKKVYKLGHLENHSFGSDSQTFLEAGKLNKAFMASENHRHYPLRAPKALRKSIDLLLPTAPFFDSWGETVGRHPDLEQRDVLEVVSALLEGFSKLSSNKVPLYGYARALGGILRSFPGGIRMLDLPRKQEKLVTTGLIHQIWSIPPAAFEASWAKRALQFLALQ